MLVRFNKRTIIGGTIYTPESGEVELANDIADQVVAAGNGVVVGFGAYSNEARIATDANGNTVLVGPGGKILPYVGVAERATLKNGQPYGITRAVRNPGKLVARFVASEITINNGLPVLADHTGFDGSGVETGIVSITGQPNMLKVTPAADTTEGIRFTTFGTSVVNAALAGRIGLWVYIDALPRFGANETPTTYLKFILTTEASGATTNAIDVTFTTSQLHEGWNFLSFIQRDPTAYVTGGTTTEYHPYGIACVKYGDGTDGDIVNDALTKIIIQWANASGAVMYFDSLVTGWETQSQVVLGCDALETDVIDYVLPIFESYGWTGYVAVPARVWASGTKIVSSINGTDGYTDMVARAATLKAAGWDCINHTMNHLSLGTVTSDAEIAYEILGVQSIYSAVNWTQGNEFYASPNSSTSRLAELVIKNCGMKLQRHIIKGNVDVTPWGVPNIHHVGACGAGSAANGAYNSVTAGANTNVIGLQINSKLRILTDVMIAYGATWFPFWHYVTTVGDGGTGEDPTGDNLYMTKSALELWLAYVREKEVAGDLRVCDGMTGFYYGVGK